jgi:hypothetical protein
MGKLNVVLGITASFGCATAVLAAPSVLSGPTANPANGHQYYLLSASTWTDAEAFAGTLGGHLATVRSLAENDWILTTFGALVPDSHTQLWIGLHDPVGNDGTGAEHAANFIWSSGELVTSRNWGPGEPNNANGSEYYTQLLVVPNNALLPGDWNDTDNTDWPTWQDCGVVEVIPEPITLSLLAFGGLAMMRRRQAR